MPNYIKIKKSISLFDLFDNVYDNIQVKSFLKSIDECGNIEIKPDETNKTLNPDYNAYKTSTINFKITLESDYDITGTFQNFDYVHSIQESSENISPYFRKIGVFKEKYYTHNSKIATGITDSKLDFIKGFGGSYITTKDAATNTFEGLLGVTATDIKYVLGGYLENDLYKPNSGVQYDTNKNTNITEFNYLTEGANENTVDLKEDIFDETYLGAHEIGHTPDVANVNRGNFNILEQHLKLENFII